MSQENKNTSTYLILSTIIIGLVLALSIVLFKGIDADDLNKDNFGMFGDYFGGLLNPILTFLTVLLLIRSLTLQSETLKITAKELQNSTRELEYTKEEIRKAGEAQAAQAKEAQESNSINRRQGYSQSSIGLFSKAEQELLDFSNHLFNIYVNYEEKKVFITRYSEVVEVPIGADLINSRVKYINLNKQIINMTNRQNFDGPPEIKYLGYAKSDYNLTLELYIQLLMCIRNFVGFEDYLSSLHYSAKLASYCSMLVLESKNKSQDFLNELASEIIESLAQDQTCLHPDDYMHDVINRVFTHVTVFKEL